MKRILFAIGWIGLAGPAWSAHAPGDTGSVQASMDVSGSITVSAGGYVKGYKLDRPGQLPGYVVNLLNRAIPAWRFQPNVRHGKPVNVKAHMDIRLLAIPGADHKTTIRIDQTTFGTGHESDDAQVRYAPSGRPPPPYPVDLARQGVSGTVFLLLQINRKGRVAKAAVQQVNLATRGGPNLMSRWRKEFADSALQAARKWRFEVPTEGKYASADDWYAQVPVQYRLSTGETAGTNGRYAYGKWQPYIPGPRRFIPWAQTKKMLAHGTPPVGRGIHMVGSGLHRIDNANS